MKIKQLVWKDNITESGKSQGVFQIKSKVDALELIYSIKNFKDKQTIPIVSTKFMLLVSHGGDDILYKENITLEAAKKLAQKNFKEVVANLFFEKD